MYLVLESRYKAFYQVPSFYFLTCFHFFFACVYLVQFPVLSKCFGPFPPGHLPGSGQWIALFHFPSALEHEGAGNYNKLLLYKFYNYTHIK